ncbi:MAG TPA: DUF2334 domain-containing protein [Solirubrobacteraceae bacterium]|jgi:peptidoglycan/xylan/chitin deacetylase (PgdA/CDA1 family)|nr:DUF2334 domain-containing protein [Solirubrobacteraceae bacterium]
MNGERPASERRERDRLRTARLLLAAELADGSLAETALQAPAVRRATRVRAVPPAPVRVGQLVLRRLGRLDYERRVARPLRTARAAALAAHGTPLAERAPVRLLVRVDEFPHYLAADEPRRFGTDAFARFHEIMRAAGVPYLIAALPRVSREPLSPRALGSRALTEEEAQMLRALAGEGVTLGLHGLDHRTRHASPRRHSELCGLDPAATQALIEQGLAELHEHGLSSPEVFVAPYNRFDADQLTVLARSFAVVCGGPESVGTLGFQRPPQWRGDCVYLPAYAPYYGHAAEVAVALAGGDAALAGLWTPVALHWGWEADAGWEDLKRLADQLARLAVPWPRFLADVRASRGRGQDVQ